MLTKGTTNDPIHKQTIHIIVMVPRAGLFLGFEIGIMRLETAKMFQTINTLPKCPGELIDIARICKLLKSMKWL